jgi:hypothetical protein
MIDGVLDFWGAGRKRTVSCRLCLEGCQTLTSLISGAYLEGYKCLACFQELTVGAKVARDMPGHRRYAGTLAEDKHDLLYRMGYDWLSGKDVSDLGV